MEGVGSCFHVLRSRTRFRHFRGRRISFPCFASPYSFSAAPRASDPVFMFCAPILNFSDTEGVESRFQVLRARTHFRRNRWRLFSCFALTDMFLAVWRASGPVFMFYATELIFNGTNGVGSRFHVLCARTRIRRCEGRRVPFSCFALPDSFSAVLRALCLVFMFCVHVLDFDGSEGVGSHFHVLRPRTRFLRYRGIGSRFHVLRSRPRFRRFRGRQIPFSYFASPYAFLAVARASGLVFMFCAPRLIFDGFEGVGSRFHVLRHRTHFRR
jgi:hypothetical protein